LSQKNEIREQLAKLKRDKEELDKKQNMMSQINNEVRNNYENSMRKLSTQKNMHSNSAAVIKLNNYSVPLTSNKSPVKAIKMY
jgi:hypothetical protein